jgi:acyl-CoA thioesterase
VSVGVIAADFGSDTAVKSLGSGRYEGQAPGAWFGPIAPNGGFIAAVVLRAMAAELGVDDREARSLTVHFLRPPAEGSLQLEVALERVGRTASTVSTRVSQAERLMAVALCTWTRRYEGAAEWEPRPPAVPRPEETAPLSPDWPSAPRMFSQLDVRPVFGGAPFAGGDGALVGGWVRPRVAHPIDQSLLAFLCDAWWPSAFTRLSAPSPAPTLDLTIHFRGVPPAGDHPFVLGRFRSRAALHGMFEEDGELWSEDGRLLAQSRQLALLAAVV